MIEKEKRLERLRSFLFILIAFIFVFSVSASPKPKAKTRKVHLPGDRVLATKEGEIYKYPATILHVKGTKIRLIVDSVGEVWDVFSSQAEPLKFTVGQTVYARRNRNFSYKQGVVVQKAKNEWLRIRFQDQFEQWLPASMFRLAIDSVPNYCELGEMVLVPVHDSNAWIPGIIKIKKNERIKVGVVDGKTYWFTIDEIKGIDLKAGDKVMGRWKKGDVYYSGKIVQVKENKVYIRYADGDREWLEIAYLKLPQDIKLNSSSKHCLLPRNKKSTL